MNLENIKKFIELAKNEGVSELKYEEKDLKVSVNFLTSNAQVVPVVNNVAATQTPSVEVKSANSDEGLHIITSPFVGTFYSQSAPGKPEYTTVGSKIAPGQTLCILEAMKIMNEIESEVSGEIVEICAENESLVEFGQPLFKVRV